MSILKFRRKPWAIRLMSSGGKRMKRKLQHKSWARSNCYILVIVSILTITLCYILFKEECLSMKRNTKLSISFQDKFKHSISNYIIENEGCSILKLYPFHDSIKRFTWKSQRDDCIKHPLLNRSRFHVWIIEENKSLYNITDDNYICCFQPFHRPNSTRDVYDKDVDGRVEYGDCMNFTNKISSGSHEFARVTCYSRGVEVYKTMFIFAPKKPKLYQDEIISDYATLLNSYNVLIFGIDSVSRMNLYRTMPKTVQFLKDLGATELLGYTKVGLNTYPNLVPMFIGCSATEIRGLCRPFKMSTHDGCPFVWNSYKTAGYYTAFVEDAAFYGAFNWQEGGFLRAPTDYYFFTFMHQIEKHKLNKRSCVQEKYLYEIILEYAKDVLRALKDSKLFGVFWENDLTHDDINAPSLMDEKYVNFLMYINQASYLNDSVVFLISDHGMRFGKLRETKQGNMEYRLPFVYILLPSKFRQLYSLACRNLDRNANRLTNPFDIHETLKDLIDVNNLTDDTILRRSGENYANNRGISLFLPVPTNRTCEMAGIPEQWCVCVKRGEVVKNTTLTLEAAQKLVEHLNKMLENYKQCARLELKEAVKGEEVVSESKVDSVRKVFVQARVVPSEGLFEGTLRLSAGGWAVLGSVSRINAYGNQSYCVGDVGAKDIMPFCFCI